MRFTAHFLHNAEEVEKQKRSFRGLPIVIEDPKGSVRKGIDPEGRAWSREMKCNYGFIPQTSAAGDEENVDVYVGDDEDAEYAYVVEQVLENGDFDEYKVMLGFGTLEAAEEMYQQQGPDTWDGLGDISEVPLDYLFDAVEEHQKTAASGHYHHISPTVNRKSIKRRGLVPQTKEFYEVSRPKGIYLFGEKDDAINWAYNFWHNYREADRGLDLWQVTLDPSQEILEDTHPDAKDTGAVYTTTFIPSGALRLESYLTETGEQEPSNEDGHREEDDIEYLDDKTAADTDLIDKFVAQYARQRQLYAKAADVVRSELAAACESHHIRAAVISRAKDVESLRKKLVKRNVLRPYADFKDIRSDIKDLAGVRVALYFPIDREPVGEIINGLYKQARPPKHFPEDQGPGDGSDYEATHFAVKYAGLVVEIQVASALMLAWSEVAHDMIYKPRMGEVTPAEYQLLAELKDIVSAGEHTVTQLQDLVQNRIASISSEARRVAARLYVTTILSRRDQILAGN
jgi:ppGpp synthetase/RelA/SpoT-type nucleotidyltranferase